MNLAWIKGVFLLVIISFCGILSSAIYADSLTAIGDWQTIDHQTQLPSSVIRIWQKGNRYYGKVVKIYRENGHDSSDRCVRCKGALYNKPILGLTIINDFIAQKEGIYGYGKILDPSSGKLYHCNLRVVDRNQQLRVHGYVGLPILGKTDVWVRVKSESF